jgi:hypothetical protein
MAALEPTPNPRRSSGVRYIGGLSGTGLLTCKGKALARVAFDFDRFSKEPAGTSMSGEIRLKANQLRGIFGRTDIQLHAEDGTIFVLRFSEKALAPDSDVAHVEVVGDNGEQAADRSPSNRPSRRMAGFARY